jgi:hypothetical protein
MSESVSATMRRALGASTESRALVTAVLPAVSYGMSHSAETHSGLSEALESLAGDPSFSASRAQVIDSLGSLGMDVSSDTEFALLMSAVQTSVFVVHYATQIEEDPVRVWRRYIEQMVSTESELGG